MRQEPRRGEPARERRMELYVQATIITTIGKHRYSRDGGYRRETDQESSPKTPTAAVCSGSRVTNSTVMKLHGSDNRGGTAVKTYTKSTCSYTQYTYCYTVTTRMTCIKMGSDESHFSVSLIVRDRVTRQCPQTTTFEEKGEPKRYRTEVLLLTSLPP